MTRIAQETQNYYLQNQPKRKGYISLWAVPPVARLYVFFGLTMLMRLVCKNRVKDYWSPDPLLATPFPVYLTRDRCGDLLTFLHLFDNIRTPRKKPQPMMKIEKIIQNL